MGCVDTIRYGKFPEQSRNIGRRVDVCFHYDTEHSISGVIVREDREEPWEMIIKLDDGRYVKGTECQFRFQ